MACADAVVQSTRRVAFLNHSGRFGNVSRTLTSSDLYEDGIEDFGKRCFSLIVMKTATVSLMLSTTLLLALASHAQTGVKKDKTDDRKSPGVDATATFSSSASITIAKDSSTQQNGQKVAFGAHLEPILKTVSASEEQRKSITAIMEEFKVRIVPLRKRHDELQQQFLKALTSGESGETILATQSEFIRAQNDLQAQYLALRLKVQQVLSPEQNEKFKEYRLKQGWKSK